MLFSAQLSTISETAQFCLKVPRFRLPVRLTDVIRWRCVRTTSGKHRSIWRKSCPGVTSTTTSLTRTGLGTSPDLRWDMPAITRFSHDMFFCIKPVIFKDRGCTAQLTLSVSLVTIEALYIQCNTDAHSRAHCNTYYIFCECVCAQHTKRMRHIATYGLSGHTICFPHFSFKHNLSEIC